MKTPAATLTRSYGYGWQQFKKYFLHVFLVGLVLAVASVPSELALWTPGRGQPGSWHMGSSVDSVMLSVLVAGYMLLVLPVVYYGSHMTYVRYMRDERADIRGIFSGFRANYLNIVLANLLVFAIVGIGMLLLVVPGIIFGCRLSLVPYLVMDRGLDPVAAIEKSWNMTRGHGWRIFAMYLVAIILICIGFMLVIVPAFFAWIYASCAFASFYHAVDLQEKAALNGNGAT
jgi:uncharacterized membrane protein